MQLKTFFLFAVTIIISSSCTRSLDNNPSGVATAGTWKVTLFSDSGNDETSDFAGYSFTFNADGSLLASNGSISKTGTWSTGSSKFTINLGPKDNTNKPLGELTDDWKIISTSDTQIKLTDDNSSSGEFLTFSKN